MTVAIAAVPAAGLLLQVIPLSLQLVLETAKSDCGTFTLEVSCKDPNKRSLALLILTLPRLLKSNFK